MAAAQVHRFREKVAIHLPGKGETVYLTQKEARAIARALTSCARDIGARKFTESQFTTVAVEVKTPGAQD